MLRKIRVFARQFIQNRLKSRGWTMVPSGLPWIEQGYFERRIVELGIDTVIDVGANLGQFGLACRREGFHGQILSFEPQPDVFEELEKITSVDSAWKCFPFALGDTESTVTLHKSAFSPSSSLLGIGKLHTDLMPFTKEIAEVQVQVKTLDSVISSLDGVGSKLAVKIDVQGYESQVLEGARQTMEKVVLASVEMNFAPLFEGQSKWTTVAATVLNSGLQFSTLTNISGEPVKKTILWADAVFERESAIPK
jgi:FkbM family methyltransferase